MPQPTAELPVPDGDRREEILAHALDLVQEGGLPALTMKKVAERVGFTEAAAYRYFPRKRDLVAGLIERLGGGFMAAVKEIAGRGDLEPSDRLERIVRTHLDLIHRTGGLPVLILAEAAATGDMVMLAKLRGGIDRYLGVLESLLPVDVPGTETLGRHDASVLLFALATVLAIRLRVGGDPAAEKAVTERLLPFVLDVLTGSRGGES